MSGTCWSFASLSFLESEILRTQKAEIDLSEMFVARHAYYIKIKEHLRQKGKNFFTSGGQFQDVQHVVAQFGLMPEAAYSGLVNGAENHDHGLLDTAIINYVRKLVAKQQWQLKPADSIYINGLFDTYLGALPNSFEYNGKTYTAKSFATDVVQLNMDEYVVLTSYNHHKMNSNIVLEDKYNWSGSTYYNVPYNKFVTYAQNAINQGYSLLWDGDITNNDFLFELGTAQTTLTNKKNVEQMRNRNFLTGKSRIDHVMHIVGKAALANSTKKELFFTVKNSWGASNAYGGYIYMNENYFAIETMAIVVHNDVLLLEE